MHFILYTVNLLKKYSYLKFKVHGINLDKGKSTTTIQNITSQDESTIYKGSGGSKTDDIDLSDVCDEIQETSQPSTSKARSICSSASDCSSRSTIMKCFSSINSYAGKYLYL